MKTFDVFLDSGVSVELPDSVDPDTDEGYLAIKDAARAKLMRLLVSNGFDVQFEGTA